MILSSNCPTTTSSTTALWLGVAQAARPARERKRGCPDAAAPLSSKFRKGMQRRGKASGAVSPAFDLAALRRGDEKSWGEAVDYLAPRLISAAVKKVAMHSAEDLVQATLVTLAERVQADRCDSELLRFAFFLLNHKIIDFYRKESRARNKIAKFQQEAESEPDFDVLIEDAEEGAVIHQALGELSERDRNIVVDRFLNGLKFEELSAKYDLAIGTVAYRLKKALGRLRSQLEKDPTP